MACNYDSVNKIFSLKGRPSSNPLIAHVLNKEWIEKIALPSDQAFRLCKIFWPGPLTLVLPKKKIIPDNLSAGLPTIGIRSPAHHSFRKVLEIVKQPIAAPSANLANRVSPTSVEHVVDNFGKDCPPILDGGNCQYGLESTVLDLTSNEPCILRPGAVTLNQIEDILKCIVKRNIGTTSNVHVSQKSPGTSSIHYAPKTPLNLFRNFHQMVTAQKEMTNEVVVVPSLANSQEFNANNVTTLALSQDGCSISIAKNLYRVLQNADKLGKDKINACLLEGNEKLTPAINDRLIRASNLFFR